MKVNYLVSYLIILSVVLLSACSDNDNQSEDEGAKTPTLSDNAYVNDWIFSEMDTWYLWRDNMPDKKSLDFESKPVSFFESLLYNKESSKGYTFSAIEENQDNMLRASSGMASLGLEYAIGDIGDNSYVFVIQYVYPGTDAALKGLKRGDVIFTIDNLAITSSNMESILQGKDNYKLGVIDIRNNKTFAVDLKPTIGYEEHPVWLDSIYAIDNHKIGYLVYNSFDPEDLGNRRYDVDLLNKLANFKDKGVTDVILDLRYNGGGYVSSAEALVSALIPQFKDDEIFSIKKYNSVIQKDLDLLPNTNTTKKGLMYSYLQKDLSSLDGSKKKLLTISNLGGQLNSLYVIGTEMTASASEFVFNCLKPYYKDAGKTIQLVGATTLGKNVGSTALYEENDLKNPYVLWPITFVIYNKNMESDYAEGIKPDISTYEYTGWDSTGLKDLGDINENLLSAAINAITGRSQYSLRSSNNSNLKIVGSSVQKKRLYEKTIDIRQ